MDHDSFRKRWKLRVGLGVVREVEERLGSRADADGGGCTMRKEQRTESARSKGDTHDTHSVKSMVEVEAVRSRGERTVRETRSESETTATRRGSS